MIAIPSPLIDSAFSLNATRLITVRDYGIFSSATALTKILARYTETDNALVFNRFTNYQADGLVR